MRRLLLAAGAASCLLTAAAPAWAQYYPSPRYDEDRGFRDGRGYREDRGRGYDRDDDRRGGRYGRDDDDRRRGYDDDRRRGYGRDDDRRDRDDDRRGPPRGVPQAPAASPRGGASALCITSRGNCGTRPLPLGAPCSCNLPGVGMKRGNVGSYGN